MPSNGNRYPVSEKSSTVLGWSMSVSVISFHLVCTQAQCCHAKSYIHFALYYNQFVYIVHDLTRAFV